MSGAHQRQLIAAGGPHPAVLDRRRRDLALLGSSSAALLVLAVVIDALLPSPSLKLIVLALVGAALVTVCLLTSRYELTLALLALYLGLLDGPVKLISGGGAAASVVRDILILAISLGAAVRVIVRREHVRLPPLCGWVLAFVALVVVQAANPSTHGVLKILGGFRQQLEWIPFFFFGYLLMRSNKRFRTLFILLGVIATVNGLVSTYQTHITPAQLASWGPGYSAYVHGGETLSSGGAKLTGRTYLSEGVARVRPPALGSDEGFGGSMGVLALPGLLALLIAGRVRRRWAVMVLCLGALLAIATSLQRTQVLAAVVAVVSFALVFAMANRRAIRPLGALLAVLGMALALTAALGSTEGSGTFSRYLSIAPGQAGSTVVDYREKTLLQLPKDIINAPLGVGLGSIGAAAGFGQHSRVEIEGKGASGESQYNYVTLELGLPGLLLWIALTINLIVLGLRGLRRIADRELRSSLVAVLAVLITFTLSGLAGPTMASPPFGPYFWFAAGIFAYWFATKRRATRMARSVSVP